MRKSTLIVLLMAIGLGAFVYFYEIKGGKEREEAEEKAKQIFPFDEKEIAEITLHRGDQTVVLEKRDDTWFITRPIHTKAEKYSVDAIARNVTTTEVNRRFTPSDGKLSAYGLDDPKIVVTVKLKSGQRHRLAFGAEDFTGGNRYVRIDDRSEIALVPTYVFSSVDKSLFDLRDKSLFDVERSAVKSLELETPRGRFALVKQGDDWRLERPRVLPADSSEVSSILSKLTFARMTEVVVEEAEELKAYGLDHPTLVARLRTEGGEEYELMLGKKADDHYYGKTNRRRLIFKVGTDVFDKLNTTLFDLRNKKPAPFHRDDIVRLRLKNEHQTLVAEKSEDKWVLKEPTEHKDKEIKPYKLFNPLEFSDAKEIFDTPSEKLKAALKDPAIEVELTTKDGQTITIDISRKTDDTVYVRNSLSPAVMTFGVDLFNDLNFKVEDILQKNAS